jgi:methylated-DNA-protein-cysteine methyltransferase-like protein
MQEETFYEKVYAVVRLVPSGRATTYGAIAKYLGAGRSSRLVGWAMNQCHAEGCNVPAHRVVNRMGILSGKAHFETPTAMQERLESEGVIIVDDQIQDFAKVFWDPAVELIWD